MPRGLESAITSENDTPESAADLHVMGCRWESIVLAIGNYRDSCFRGRWRRHIRHVRLAHRMVDWRPFRVAFFGYLDAAMQVLGKQM